MTLDVAISTYKPEGIRKVEKMLQSLERRPDVRYVVSWQEHENAPLPKALEERPDVAVHRLDAKGLSNNRNNAIEHSRSDIILIADDDLEYEPDFADKIIAAFEKDPGLDLATFKLQYFNPKTYPSESKELKIPLPKNYFVSSVEIAFRRESIGDLRFYPELGLGASTMHGGEEELFLASAIKRGLSCRFENSIIGRHPEPTTGDKVSEEILRGQGFIISLFYPLSFILRVPLKAYRQAKNKRGNFAGNFKNIWQGSILAKKTLREIPQCYRW